MNTPKYGNPYILRIRMGGELRQALADAAQVQDRGLSSLCRSLLREGLRRLDDEGVSLAESARPPAARSDTNGIDATRYPADSPGGVQTMNEQKGHQATASLIPTVEAKGSRS